MTDRVQRVLAALGGDLHTVEEVAALSGVPRLEVARILAELLHTGLVELFTHSEDGREQCHYRLSARARLTDLPPSQAQ